MKIIKIIFTSFIMTIFPIASMALTPTAESVRIYDAYIVGNLAGTNQSVTISPDGYGTVVFSVAGTFSGTLIPEVSVDGINYYPISVVPTSGGSITQNITTTGSWHAGVSAFANFRIRESSYSSGNAIVNLRLAAGITDLIAI